MTPEEFEEHRKELEEKGLIGYDKGDEELKFLFVILWVLIIAAIIIFSLKHQGLI